LVERARQTARAFVREKLRKGTCAVASLEAARVLAHAMRAVVPAQPIDDRVCRLESRACGALRACALALRKCECADRERVDATENRRCPSEDEATLGQRRCEGWRRS
jgi:hypothetical protein